MTKYGEWKLTKDENCVSLNADRHILPGGTIAYREVIEPEVVTLYGTFLAAHRSGVRQRISVKSVDGKIDWSTLRAETDQ